MIQLQKFLIIGLIAFVLLIPINAFSINISEIERKLSQAQSEDDVEKVMEEILKSNVYKDACKELFEKMKIYHEQNVMDNLSSLSEKKQTEIISVVQDYQSLKCMFTEDYWQDAPEPPIMYTQNKCDEITLQFDEHNKKYHDSYREGLLIVHEEHPNKNPVNFVGPEFFSSKKMMEELTNEFHSNCIPVEECEKMQAESDIMYADYRKLTLGSLEEQLSALEFGMLGNKINLMCNFKSSVIEYHEFMEKYHDKSIPSSKTICGEGTMDVNGQCVVDPNYKTQSNSRGGGCLIATATYGSELTPQVQQLRELRDNQLLSTTSGTNFMNTFNSFYYSFSPIIADYERENPVFKEMVKVAITPMITSLSILNYVELDSEESILGYGILLIMLNVMMYVGIPVIAVIRLRK